MVVLHRSVRNIDKRTKQTVKRINPSDFPIGFLCIKFCYNYCTLGFYWVGFGDCEGQSILFVSCLYSSNQSVPSLVPRIEAYAFRFYSGFSNNLSVCVFGFR